MRHDDIRRRLEAATPGLWASAWDDADIDDEYPLIYAGSPDTPVVSGMWYDGVRAACTREDAELIAHAPEDLRTLLDENARFRAELTALADDWADCSDSRARLKREVEALRGLLRRLEWVRYEPSTCNWTCALCFGSKDHEGHAPGCALAAALEAT